VFSSLPVASSSSYLQDPAFQQRKKVKRALCVAYVVSSLSLLTVLGHRRDGVIVDYALPLRILFHHIPWRRDVLTRTSVRTSFPTLSPRCPRTLRV